MNYFIFKKRLIANKQKSERVLLTDRSEMLRIKTIQMTELRKTMYTTTIRMQMRQQMST